jgi:hypothetical protein
MARVSLAEPPAHGLDTVAHVMLGEAALGRLFRIFHHRSPDGRVNSPWRFDLPAPEGTCSWSDTRFGCFVERFRGARLISADDLRGLRLWTAAPPPTRMANLLDRSGYGDGLTAEIHTIADYALPQRWALALRRAGFAGVVGSCRHDPSSTARNIAVFGPADSPARRVGWRTSRSRVETDPVLARELAVLGVRVQSIPFDVPVAVPPR